MDSKYTMEERGNNYTLTISEVRQTDLGDYTCTAVNKISEQQAQVVLTGKLNFENQFRRSKLNYCPPKILDLSLVPIPEKNIFKDFMLGNLISPSYGCEIEWRLRYNTQLYCCAFCSLLYLLTLATAVYTIPFPVITLKASSNSPILITKI